MHFPAQKDANPPSKCLRNTCINKYEKDQNMWGAYKLTYKKVRGIWTEV